MESNIVHKLDNLLPLEKLKKLAQENHDNYVNADPFAHIVLDNVFDEEILKEILREFEISLEKWKHYETKYEKKYQLSKDEEFGTFTRIFLHALNSEPFVKFLEELTGIEKLIPDYTYAGGGLHHIPPGGKLGVHVDFNHHKELNVYRRINAIIYLNEDWEEMFGGHLELWNTDRTQCIQKILPVFNRMAIFNTTSYSYHGHPEPLNCPPDRARRSLALYYYTAEEKGEQAGHHHSTVWINEKGGTEELGKMTFMQKVKNKLKKIL